MEATTSGISNFSANLTTAVNDSAVYVKSWKELYMVVMYHTPLALAVDRFTTPVCCVIGFVGNIISVRIWVMRRMRKCNSSASYLATLAVSDLMFLVLVIPNELHYAWALGTLGVQVWCQLWNIMYMATQYLSLLLVCAFTLERFLSVCRPFDCQRFAKTSRSAKVIVGIFCTSILLSLPQGFFWAVSEGDSECRLRERDFQAYHFWNWASEVVMFGVLPIVALILNICVLRQIRTVDRLYVTEGASAMMMSRGGVVGGSSGSQSAVNARCATTTVTLLWISFYLIFTKLPVTIVFAMQTIIGLGKAMSLEDMSTDPTWQRYLTYFTVRKVIEEVGISHHACNIFIYCLTSRQFRKHLKLMCWNCVYCSKYEYAGSGRTPASNKTNKTNKNGV